MSSRQNFPPNNLNFAGTGARPKQQTGQRAAGNTNEQQRGLEISIANQSDPHPRTFGTRLQFNPGMRPQFSVGFGRRFDDETPPVPPSYRMVAKGYPKAGIKEDWDKPSMEDRGMQTEFGVNEMIGIWPGIEIVSLFCSHFITPLSPCMKRRPVTAVIRVYTYLPTPAPTYPCPYLPTPALACTIFV